MPLALMQLTSSPRLYTLTCHSAVRTWILYPAFCFWLCSQWTLGRSTSHPGESRSPSCLSSPLPFSRNSSLTSPGWVNPFLSSTSSPHFYHSSNFILCQAFTKLLAKPVQALRVVKKDPGHYPCSKLYRKKRRRKLYPIFNA